MRLRRILLAFIVLGGFVVLILGISGVFSPRKPEAGSAQENAPESAATSEPGYIEVGGLKIQEKDWLLTAEQARTRKEGGTELVMPVLEARQPSSSGEERLTARADKGTYEAGPPKRLRMSGGVHIEFLGKEKLVLTTPSIEVEPDEGTGRTAEAIELVADSEEGRQHIWGKGAEFAAKERRIVVSENVRMELISASGGIFPRSGAEEPGKKAAPQVTTITCRGPVTADGFSRTVDLKGAVHVEQGENRLDAGRMEVQFAEKGRTPERFTAEGAVTFTAAGATGACDRLTRSSLEDQLVLEGRPASVQQGPNHVEAARIELSMRKREILVPGAGKLTLVQEGADAAAPPVRVTWKDMLRLDPSAHQAHFRGAVHFERGEQTIDCQTLTVNLDQENRQILECRADTNVRLKGRMEPKPDAPAVDAECREMVYAPQKDSAVLSGGAKLRQGRRTISGEHVEFHPRDASILVAGPGRFEGPAEEAGKGAAGVPAEEFSISWVREMRFARAAQKADFSGQVIFKYQGNTLRAESLSAELGENALKGIETQGGASLEYSEGTLRAESLSAQLSGNALKGFEAAGGVVLQQRGGADNAATTLHADRLTAQMGADRKIEGILATGHVLLDQPGAAKNAGGTLSADNLSATLGADRKLQGIKARGNVIITTVDAAEHITRTVTADRVDSTTEENGKVLGYEANGRVAYKEDDGKPLGVRTMKADKFIAKVDAGDQLEAFEAVGRAVTVEDADRRARGERLVWDARRDRGTLYGSPAELRLGQSRFFGREMDFSRKRGEITVVSDRRVEGVVVGGVPGTTAALP